MNPKVAARQARLLQMLESKEEIRIGREQDCPLPLPQLVRLTRITWTSSRSTVTGSPPRCSISGGGHHWCLKRCPPGLSGGQCGRQTAFLTELERRREIESLQELHPTILSNVVSGTSFGSARPGAGLPWLQGEPVPALRAQPGADAGGGGGAGPLGLV